MERVQLVVLDLFETKSFTFGHPPRTVVEGSEVQFVVTLFAPVLEQSLFLFHR